MNRQEKLNVPESKCALNSSRAYNFNLLIKTVVGQEIMQYYSILYYKEKYLELKVTYCKAKCCGAFS